VIYIHTYHPRLIPKGVAEAFQILLRDAHVFPKLLSCEEYCTCLVIFFHHQPINIPTAGAQAFLMDYLQGERALTLHAGPVRIGGC
jgi:hypothetical protein